MTPERRLDALLSLAPFTESSNEELHREMEKAYQHNKWFTLENISLALKNIREQFLDESKLKKWLARYLSKNHDPKTVGIVMAGNLPLVGFHDFLCVILSGNKSLIKLSSKDNVLFHFITKKLFQIEPEMKEWISFSENLKEMDAMIATGSNNSARYFDYYFGKYPHIIRKNRSSVAVLKGDETKEDLETLGIDIFSFFGLGCRNVSKLMVPDNYSFDFLFQSLDKFSTLNEHNKYKNNYDYNLAIFLLNKTPILANDFLIVGEDIRVASPVAMLHHEFYRDENDLKEKLKRDEENIQCIVGKEFIPFGQSQAPELWDYADNVDTMKFLTELE